MGLFNRKEKKRKEELIKQFEEGRILQVDNEVDNKEYLLQPVAVKVEKTAEEIAEEKEIEAKKLRIAELQKRQKELEEALKNEQ